MAPLAIFLLSLPFLALTTGSAQTGGNVSSLTTAAPFLDKNQTSVTQLTTQKSTRSRIEFIYGGSEEEYDYDDDETLTVAPTFPVATVPCQYDGCKHLASTCEEIRLNSGGKCLCPGIDGPKSTPDSPPLKEVLPGDSQVTLNWCSPSSTVHGYRVLHGEPGKTLEKGPDLNTSFRSYTIDRLNPGTLYTVCVVAFNEAGESQVGEVEDRPAAPCKTVQTTMQSLYIAIGVGLTAVAGLLFILAYFLLRRKQNKMKTESNLEDRGISNYTYKAGSVDRL
ncbi:LRRN4 C-terminal-like protein [Dendropsophus ebraccatus]|uniref:LRRN4 C-terminal-like protein n=1 Tax=Dendropsophus ebraccatus TaxID=150705 RepID=UPI00383156E5